MHDPASDRHGAADDDYHYLDVSKAVNAYANKGGKVVMIALFVPPRAPRELPSFAVGDERPQRECDSGGLVPRIT
jgi:hypothetical protein